VKTCHARLLLILSPCNRTELEFLFYLRTITAVTVPQDQAASIPPAGKYLRVAEATYEQPGDREIIIKSRAVATKLVDRKIQDHGIVIQKYPSVFGCDIAGAVAEVGKQVKRDTIDDRVIERAE